MLPNLCQERASRLRRNRKFDPAGCGPESQRNRSNRRLILKPEGQTAENAKYAKRKEAECARMFTAGRIRLRSQSVQLRAVGIARGCFEEKPTKRTKRASIFVSFVSCSRIAAVHLANERGFPFVFRSSIRFFQVH